MKRKKPPIALISVLVVAALGLVISGKAFSIYTMSMEEQEEQFKAEAEARERSKPKPPETTKPDNSGAVTAMKEKMKVGAARSTPTPASTSDGGPRKNFKTAVPTVIMPDEKLEKPKPNTSGPTTQWYGNN